MLFYNNKFTQNDENTSEFLMFCFTFKGKNIKVFLKNICVKSQIFLEIIVGRLNKRFHEILYMKGVLNARSFNVFVYKC